VSRSYRTNPYQVQLAQDPTKRRAWHDHRFHDCNLAHPRQVVLANDVIENAPRWYASCEWIATKSARNLVDVCSCNHCAYAGATPPKKLRRRGRQILTRVVMRPVSEADLDFVADRVESVR